MSGSAVFFDTIEKTSIHTGSGTFDVPNRVIMLRLLGIGAGAGGGVNASSAGAGAGNIENLFIPVTPGETVTITIGVGGAGRTGSPGLGSDGGDTIVATSAKTYHFLGGLAAGAGTIPPKQRRYAQDGATGATSAAGGVAGYEDGGDGGTTFVDGQDGGIGAGGGYTTDFAQTGGDGGDGRVQLWFRD